MVRYMHVPTVVDNPDNREEKSKFTQPHKKMVWILRKIIWVLVSINRQKTIVVFFFFFLLKTVKYLNVYAKSFKDESIHIRDLFGYIRTRRERESNRQDSIPERCQRTSR